MIELLNIDCMEYMATQEDDSFDFVGCEIDKEYFELAQKRFDRHSTQLNLF